MNIQENKVSIAQTKAHKRCVSQHARAMFKYVYKTFEYARNVPTCA